jgi:DNA excision repair protein ERCC-4
MPIDQPPIVIVQDTREQAGWGPLFQTPHTIGTLSCGDYSVLGLEELISVERKSFPDLLGSLTSGRERFESELKKARHYHRFFVLVEAPLSALLVDNFGKLSRAHPRSIWGTTCVWSTRYCPFVFGGTRADSARLCEGLLLGYAREFFKKATGMQRAARGVQVGQM